jgi:hypothetical protein
MKFYSFLFLLSLVSSLVFGYHEDPPNCTFKATITTKNGNVVNGYFICSTMSVGKTETGSYYVSGGNYLHQKLVYNNGGLLIDKTEYDFFNIVKENLRDTLEIFSDAVIFKGKTEPDDVLMPWLTGTLLKITPTQILKITIQVVYVFYAGPSLLTNVSAEDKNWITDQPLYCSDYLGDDYCSYDAIYFSGSKQSVLKNIAKLKALLIERQTNYNNQLNADSVSKAISKEVERLRTQKIIIYGYCSC